MNYKTVYDISEYGYHEWTTVIAAAVVFGVSLLLFFIFKISKKSLIWPCVTLLISIFLALMGAMTYWDYARLKNRLVEKKTQVVSGVIERHWERKVWRNKTTDYYEGFTVNGVKFEYTVDHSAAGFTNSQKEKVPLRDGLPVRVHYVKDELAGHSELRILKLEVKE
ncbi:MAG: hypothetical protein M3347_16810 [Armatimonadota bacterium]|nr:hypothetical protein [Armatimonadota bacterium]